MSQVRDQILILEKEGYFQNLLEGICVDFGQTTTVATADEALSHLTKTSYRLLLLDWNLVQSHLSPISSALETFQETARVLALFVSPDLPGVISAMKSGVSDVLWAAQKRDDLQDKIRENLATDRPAAINHSFVSRLAESLTEKSVVQKTTLLDARKEFSRTFLSQILAQKDLKRAELASLLRVSPRTVQRHLSH